MFSFWKKIFIKIMIAAFAANNQFYWYCPASHVNFVFWFYNIFYRMKRQESVAVSVHKILNFRKQSSAFGSAEIFGSLLGYHIHIHFTFQN
jgi:hypothetical protein